MTKPRAIFRLHVGVASVGVLATILALITALGAVSLALPSPGELLAACQSFVLPHPSVASVVTLALGSLAFTVLVLAGRSVVGQLRASRRFVHELGTVSVRRLAGEDVMLFESGRVSAFCTGMLRPRVFLSSGALARLDPDELSAVVAHEAHHARMRDPLRIFLARVMGDSLFFLPALRRLGEGYASLAELAADAAAIRRSQGDTRPLASALLAFTGPADDAVVGIAPERVDQLMGERPVWQLPIALLAWAAIAVVGVSVVAHRAADASAMSPVNLPLLMAQMCMITMTVAPLLLGAAVLLRSRSWIAGKRA